MRRTDLNQNCIVSVLNRTTRVNPDGSWILPNIPAGFGRVRARATCVQAGITRSGQSDFFSIPANGNVDASAHSLGRDNADSHRDHDHVAKDPLKQLNETSQLTVIASFAGQADRNVTTSGYRHYPMW